jgi:coenzyme F420-0:L-glutamate ligase/coenzyme F420-1:gamma-L-glutamate ligase
LPTRLVLTALEGLPLIQPGDDLAGLVFAALEAANLRLKSGDVIAVAQKVVSKAEGRLVNLSDVTPSPEAIEVGGRSAKDPRLVQLILSESQRVLRVRPGLIIVRHRLGFVCANAGIDHSNVRGEGGRPEDWVLLLPEDPDASAQRLRERFERASGQAVGVLVIDSHGRAWRVGAVGVAIGLAGLPGVLNLRGRPDLYGYRLQTTDLGLADELAAAASALMGQADEATPVVHIRGLRYPLREGSSGELLRPESQDLFRD